MNPIPNDHIEFGGMQNLMEFLFPYQITLDLANSDMMKEFFKAFNLEWLSDPFFKYAKVGAEEKIRLSKNRDLLVNINEKARKRKVQTPGITTKKFHSKDENYKGKVDKTILKQNMFLEMIDTAARSDTTVIPLEF